MVPGDTCWNVQAVPRNTKAALAARLFGRFARGGNGIASANNVRKHRCRKMMSTRDEYQAASAQGVAPVHSNIAAAFWVRNAIEIALAAVAQASLLDRKIKHG